MALATPGDHRGGALGGGTVPRGCQDLQSAVPVQVSGLTDAVSIAASDVDGYALTADGTVWHWGGSNPFYAFSYSCCLAGGAVQGHGGVQPRVCRPSSSLR